MGADWVGHVGLMGMIDLEVVCVLLDSQFHGDPWTQSLRASCLAQVPASPVSTGEDLVFDEAEAIRPYVMILYRTGFV